MKGVKENMKIKLSYKMSAIVIAVFLYLSLFTVIPINASAAKSDLIFSGFGVAANVGDTREFTLGVKNDAGHAELKRLFAEGVTCTFSASNPKNVKFEPLSSDSYYSYPYGINVTFLNIHETIIYLKLSNGWEFEAKTPTIYNSLKDVWMVQKTASVKVGGTVQLSYDYDGKCGPKPVSNANLLTYEHGARWASSNPNVATVNQSGLVTGIKSGTAKITFSIPGLGPEVNGKRLYVISCDVAVSVDGKATVPTTTKKPTTTRKGTSIIVTQKPPSSTQKNKKSTTIITPASKSETNQSNTSTTLTVPQINKTISTENTTVISSEKQSSVIKTDPSLPERKNPGWKVIIATLFIIFITTGFAGLLIKHKIRKNN